VMRGPKAPKFAAEVSKGQLMQVTSVMKLYVLLVVAAASRGKFANDESSRQLVQETVSSIITVEAESTLSAGKEYMVVRTEQLVQANVEDINTRPPTPGLERETRAPKVARVTSFGQLVQVMVHTIPTEPVSVNTLVRARKLAMVTKPGQLSQVSETKEAVIEVRTEKSPSEVKLAGQSRQFTFSSVRVVAARS